MCNVATVINFCSNDYPFLAHAIKNASAFSSQIIISVCDHFFDGVKENKELLNQIYLEHPECQFIEFAYDKEKNLYGSHSVSYWHNLGRMLGVYFLDESIEYVLFLDADEIVESDRFCKWLSSFPLTYEAMRFSCYWYFRASSFQAKTLEDSAFLVKKSVLTGDILMHPHEREGCFQGIKGNKMRQVDGLDALPLFHHYSWVRTKEQMLRKVLSWGHNGERDWVSLVEEEFLQPFKGKDFVHGYTFQEVKPFVEIDLMKKPYLQKAQNPQNVRRVETDEIHKIDLTLRFLR